MKKPLLSEMTLKEKIAQCLCVRQYDLTQKTEEEMIKVRNLGKKSLDEVVQKLLSLGVALKKSEE